MAGIGLILAAPAVHLLARALFGHPEVGGQRELEPAAQRVAGDRGHYRLARARDQVHGGLQPFGPQRHLGVTGLGRDRDVRAAGEDLLAAVGDHGLFLKSWRGWDYRAVWCGRGA